MSESETKSVHTPLNVTKIDQSSRFTNFTNMPYILMAQAELQRAIVNSYVNSSQYNYHHSDATSPMTSDTRQSHSAKVPLHRPHHSPNAEKSGLEVYIGSDINGQPDPTKYSTNPNTTRYPNGENRTTRTRPDSELSNPNPTRPEVSN